MPWVDGKRVDLATWRLRNPLAPTVRYDLDGNRKVYEHDIVDAPEPVTLADYQQQRRDKVKNDPHRRAAIANVLGLPDDAPELDEVDTDSTYVSETGTVLAVPVEHDPVERSVTPEEPRQTTHRARSASWRAERGIGRAHRPDRLSQTSPGRHVRHVRQQAAKWGISVEVADSRIQHRGDTALTCLIQHPELAP